MDMLLAALECYNTFLGARTLEAAQIIGGSHLPEPAHLGKTIGI